MRQTKQRPARMQLNGSEIQLNCVCVRACVCEGVGHLYIRSLQTDFAQFTLLRDNGCYHYYY